MENKTNNPVAVEERLFKWMKASDRIDKLPVENVFLKGCRLDKGSLILRRYGGGNRIVLLDLNGSSVTEWSEDNKELSQIEWLEEIPIKEHLPVVEDGKALNERVRLAIADILYKGESVLDNIMEYLQTVPQPTQVEDGKIQKAIDWCEAGEKSYLTATTFTTVKKFLKSL